MREGEREHMRRSEGQRDRRSQEAATGREQRERQKKNRIGHTERKGVIGPIKRGSREKTQFWTRKGSLRRAINVHHMITHLQHPAPCASGSCTTTTDRTCSWP